MWFARRKRVHADVAASRREREEAERRLADAQHHIIGPLRELHRELIQKNHVAERLDSLIRQRLDEGGRGDPGAAHS